MFHMYDKNLYKRDVTCSWPPPLSQTITPSRNPSPSSVMYFMDGPQPQSSGDANGYLW